MSMFPRFLIAFILALFLMTGQGFTVLSSWATPCCPNITTHEAMPCCQSRDCKKHKPSNTELIKKKAETCYCSVAPVDLQQEKSTFQMDSGKLIGANNPNTTLSLQLANSNTPIWLYRLFYPDKSKLYLEKNHWLL